MCLLGAAPTVRADIQLPLPVTVPEKDDLTEQRRAYTELQVKRLEEAQRIYADADSSARAADYTWAILGGLLAAILLAYVIFTWRRPPESSNAGVLLLNGELSRSRRHRRRSHRHAADSTSAHAAGALQSMLSLLGGSSSRRHRRGHRRRSSRQDRRHRHREAWPAENNFHADGHAPTDSPPHHSFHDGVDDASDA